MPKLDNNNQHLIVLGTATFVVSFLVTAGYWDIFDLLISLMVLTITISYVNSNPEILCTKTFFLAWCSLSMISTAFLISLVAVYSGVANCEMAARVAVENIYAMKVNKENVNYFHQQSLYQFTLFCISAFFWIIYLGVKKLPDILAKKMPDK